MWRVWGCGGCGGCGGWVVVISNKFCKIGDEFDCHAWRDTLGRSFAFLLKHLIWDEKPNTGH